jgi:hypothetical protein
VTNEGLAPSSGSVEDLRVAAKARAGEYSQAAFKAAAESRIPAAGNPVIAIKSALEAGLQDGSIKVKAGEMPMYKRVLNSIVTDMAERGYNKVLPQDGIISFKRDLNPNFETASGILSNENAKNKLVKAAYYAADDLITDPTVRALNQKSSELFKLSEALEGQKDRGFFKGFAKDVVPQLATKVGGMTGRGLLDIGQTGKIPVVPEGMSFAEQRYWRSKNLDPNVGTLQPSGAGRVGADYSAGSGPEDLSGLGNMIKNPPPPPVKPATGTMQQLLGVPDTRPQAGTQNLKQMLGMPNKSKYSSINEKIASVYRDPSDQKEILNNEKLNPDSPEFDPEVLYGKAYNSVGTFNAIPIETPDGWVPSGDFKKYLKANPDYVPLFINMDQRIHPKVLEDIKNNPRQYGIGTKDNVMEYLEKIVRNQLGSE